jgi:hypothetical protein
MNVLDGTVDLLIAVNVALGAFCAACVVAVAIAVWLDVRERRRWRAMVPDCWPPPGVALEDAEDEALATNHRTPAKGGA